jgi:hypothetical protein
MPITRKPILVDIDNEGANENVNRRSPKERIDARHVSRGGRGMSKEKAMSYLSMAMSMKSPEDIRTFVRGDY